MFDLIEMMKIEEMEREEKYIKNKMKISVFWFKTN